MKELSEQQICQTMSKVSLLVTKVLKLMPEKQEIILLAVSGEWQ
jgi:hypothetical protein